jgi:hypothetical protein
VDKSRQDNYSGMTEQLALPLKSSPKDRLRAWRLANKDKVKEYARNRYSNDRPGPRCIKCGNRAVAKKLCHNHYEQSRLVKNRAVNRIWVAKNREHVRENHQQWKQNNRRARQISNQKYREKNRDKIRSRYHTDRNFRIAAILRARLYCMIKVQSFTRLAHALVGCSIDELCLHLEGLFTDGMSWDNHGIRGWHIDHIRPCASFDLSDKEQQKLCFHYTNLQPLWWIDNCTKHAKWQH